MCHHGNSQLSLMPSPITPCMFITWFLHSILSNRSIHTCKALLVITVCIWGIMPQLQLFFAWISYQVSSFYIVSHIGWIFVPGPNVEEECVQKEAPGTEVKPQQMLILPLSTLHSIPLLFPYMWRFWMEVPQGRDLSSCDFSGKHCAHCWHCRKQTITSKATVLSFPC